MKKILLTSFCFILVQFVMAQSPGDTIVVESFNYSQTYGVNQWSPGIRDTMIDFPNDANVSYEKVLMLYNMRCKNNNTSSSANRDVGCGEWDISCNTYITDSTRADSVKATHPSYIISGFSGSSYDYTTQAVYNLERHIQSNTSSSTVISETQSTVGSGALSLSDVLAVDENSSKSQYLFTEAELTAAGAVAGDLDGIMLKALSASTAGFLRVRVKHTLATTLSSATAETTGFTEVYFANTPFTNGMNRLQFLAPFNWNGTSNLLVEFSTSNTSTGSTLDIEGEALAGNFGLLSANNYHINTSSAAGFTISPSNFNGLSNEITVSFWTKGNTGVSGTSTTIINGADAAGDRQLSVHLPWSNTQVYFDCGGNNGAYDRINKLAPVQALENEWSHWAFSKNAISGEMKIYLNGTLFHSATSRNNPIDIDTLIVGSNLSLGSAYLGLIDELRIWDKELSANEIQNWMNKPIDNTHPQYASLKAYYPLNEGNGMTTVNSLNAQSSSFVKPSSWGYDRGVMLNRLFTETAERPNLTFLQGTYNLSIVNDTVFDSTLVAPNSVTAYQVVSKSGSLVNDEISISSSNSYWEAGYQYIYDGSTGVKIDSIPLTTDGTINITDLQYFRRYPSKYEIMSFVTPYGVNLNLGPNGKTWTFDVTDFLPVLKGKKRMTIERGGQWMEDMDVKFLYIVGTPPRDVLDINQLWRAESRGYNSIIADTYFEPRDVNLLSNASHFKIRSSISGHGQEGEFIPRTHFIDINGGTKEFNWQVWKACGENPIYPQGGTWIYDRAGWCPGMATDIQHFDITSLVSPGQPANIDYGVNSASGTSNYIVNNQLVSYGAINHNLDAALVDVSGPSNKVEYSRNNAICSNPSVIIENTGATDLTTLTIEYWVNDGANKQSYSWSGNLKFGEREEVNLPSPLNLWDDISGLDNKFYAEVKNPNGASDEYQFNNIYTSDFTIPDVVPSDFVLWFRTNSAANENKYEIFDGNGNSIFVNSGLTNNTLYRDTFDLAVGCYTLIITDTDGDGINFWANSDGNGSALLRQVGGGVIKTLNPDFGSSLVYNFTIDAPLSYEELQDRISLKVYPNPAHFEFTVEGKNINDTDLSIHNSIGQLIHLPRTTEDGRIKFDTRNTPKGIYIITITRSGRSQTHKVMVE